MIISYLNLKRQYLIIKNEINRAIQRVLKRQIFILGPELENFEKKFAEYIGVKYCVGLNSGTDALIFALKVLGIGKNDEVITVPNSFIATTLAITQNGARPIFVDIDPNTYEIDINNIEKKITKKTKAILPVHLYGTPCQIDKIISIAKKYKLYVIEDAAQAHGSEFMNQKVGSFGDIAIFSFYPGKNLGCYGDGGAIVTNNTYLYEKIKKLRNYGQIKKYYHKEIGINSRLDEIQASILSVKLKYLDKWNKKRNQIAEIYKKNLKNVKFQKIYQNFYSCYHIFIIETNQRNKLQSYLEKNGIQTLIHYPVPIHLQECYKYLGYKKGDFPFTEKVSESILSIPLYPELRHKEINYIISKINAFFNEK